MSENPFFFIAIEDGRWYWVNVPDQMTDDEAVETQPRHGPFITTTEARGNWRVTMFGPDSKLDFRGKWDPAWAETQ